MGERDLNPQYMAFFEHFNKHLFYEAHEVLEPLWLAERHGPDGAFYKGLIQLAGAFVHIQKGRPQPAAALLRLAETNLQGYPALHKRLELATALSLIGDWQRRLEAISVSEHSLLENIAPRLQLRSS